MVQPAMQWQHRARRLTGGGAANDEVDEPVLTTPAYPKISPPLPPIEACNVRWWMAADARSSAVNIYRSSNPIPVA